jgi:hypothetical protein
MLPRACRAGRSLGGNCRAGSPLDGLGALSLSKRLIPPAFARDIMSVAGSAILPYRFHQTYAAAVANGGREGSVWRLAPTAASASVTTAPTVSWEWK